MTWQTLVDPATNLLLPDVYTSGLSANNRFLWQQATKNWDTFTGWNYSINSTISSGERDVWRGSFVYGGVFTNGLLGAVTMASGRLKIYMDNDAGAYAVAFNGTSSPVFPMDLAGVVGNYTLGKQYRVRVSFDKEGNTNGSTHGDYLATLVANPFAPYPTMPAWTDGTVPTAANFATLNAAQKYVYTLVTPMGSSCYVACMTQGTAVLFYNGAFYVRKRSAMQTALNITYNFWSAGPVLYVYDSAGALQDTINLTGDATERVETKILTGTYTANTIARITVENPSGGGGGAIANYVRKITVGGLLSLQHPVPVYAAGNTVYGTSTAQQLAYYNEGLADARDVLRGTASDSGFAFMSPDPTVGKLDFQLPGPSIGYTIGPTVERDYTFRNLYYLASSAGSQGAMMYGKKTVQLVDVDGLGGWSVLDLSTIGDLAPGTSLRIDGVRACYQA